MPTCLMDRFFSRHSVIFASATACDNGCQTAFRCVNAYDYDSYGGFCSRGFANTSNIVDNADDSLYQQVLADPDQIFGWTDMGIKS